MQSGIYQIASPSGNVYIGSAKNIKTRWRGHLCDLRARRHHSSVLQRTFDKYGESALVFSVIEYCAVDILLVREQFYIDAVPKEKRYNVCETAGNRLGMFHTEEAKAKMSETRKGRKLNPEWAAKLAEYNRARAQTPEHRERMRKLKTGSTLSAEARAKISAAHKGKKYSEERRAQMSAVAKGVPKPRTAEHSAKIGLAHRGKTISAEQRAKISAAMKGRPATERMREVTLQNNAKRNTSGFTGVSLDKRTGKFYAYARIAGKMKNLGLHATAEAASIARAQYLAQLENVNGE